jgi:hypothetical protein
VQSRRRHRPPPPFPTTAATAPDLALLASLSPLKSVSFNCIIAGTPPWLALFFLATPPLPPPPPLSSPPPRRHLQRAQVASAGHMSLLPRRRCLFSRAADLMRIRRFFPAVATSFAATAATAAAAALSPISDEYPSSFRRISVAFRRIFVECPSDSLLGGIGPFRGRRLRRRDIFGLSGRPRRHTISFIPERRRHRHPTDVQQATQGDNRGRATGRPTA